MGNCTTNLSLGFLACILFFSSSLSAQYATTDTKNPFKTAKAFYPETVNSPNKKKYTPIVRKTKRIAADYESFAIVLRESDRPLVSTDPIFRQFGSVVYDRSEKGLYTYMICTPFSSKKNVEEFMAAVIQSRFPDSRVIQYDGGSIR